VNTGEECYGWALYTHEDKSTEWRPALVKAPKESDGRCGVAWVLQQEKTAAQLELRNEEVLLGPLCPKLKNLQWSKTPGIDPVELKQLLKLAYSLRGKYSELEILGIVNGKLNQKKKEKADITYSLMNAYFLEQDAKPAGSQGADGAVTATARQAEVESHTAGPLALGEVNISEGPGILH